MFKSKNPGPKDPDLG